MRSNEPIKKVWLLFKQYPNLLITLAEGGYNVDLVKLKRMTEE